MGAERGSYRRERRNEAGKAARKLKDGKNESLFFGASPDERKELRKTEDKKSIKLDDLDMNAAIDRSKLNAPQKVGENVRLIDIAMGKAPVPGPDPQRIGAEVPGEALPVEGKKKKRRPVTKHRSRAARAASASMQIAIQVQAGVSPHLEKLAWVAAVLLAGAAFAAQPVAESLAAELAADASALRAAGWEAAQGQGLTAALAWSRELGLLLAGLAAWTALAVRTWRAFRSPSKLLELLRTLLLAALPTLVLGGAALWLGGQLPLPWLPPAWLVDPLRSALAPVASALPVPLWQAALGFVGLLSLVVANGRRRRRPLQQIPA